ncbi:FAD-binding oxidoreductase [soil metagenome]
MGIPEHSDIVIVGGGISGTAAAYELALRGFKPLLLERSELAAMASGWTLGGVRQSGRHSAELPLAKAAVNRWTNLSHELDADVEYRQGGNLRLARNPSEAERIVEVVDSTRAAGISIEYLPDHTTVSRLAPALSGSIYSGSYCPTDGHANPTSTVQAYARAAASLGAAIATNVEVLGIEVLAGRVCGVTTRDGGLSCDRLIVAAGVFTAELLSPLGLSVPLSIRMVPVFQTVIVEPFLEPVLGVATGDLAARQEVNGCLRLSGGGQNWEPGLCSLRDSAESVQPTPGDLTEVTARAIQLLPRFETMRIRRVWGGLVDQTPDGLPVYSASTGVHGLVVAAGFSGHGFGIGPVSGEILADLVVDETTDYPIHDFTFDRFEAVVGANTSELHG